MFPLSRAHIFKPETRRRPVTHEGPRVVQRSVSYSKSLAQNNLEVIFNRRSRDKMENIRKGSMPSIPGEPTNILPPSFRESAAAEHPSRRSSLKSFNTRIITESKRPQSVKKIVLKFDEAPRCRTSQRATRASLFEDNSPFPDFDQSTISIVQDAGFKDPMALTSSSKFPISDKPKQLKNPKDKDVQTHYRGIHQFSQLIRRSQRLQSKTPEKTEGTEWIENPRIKFKNEFLSQRLGGGLAFNTLTDHFNSAEKRTARELRSHRQKKDTQFTYLNLLLEPQRVETSKPTDP